MRNIVEYEEYCDNLVRQSNFLVEATSVAKLSLNGRKYFELLSSMVNQENENDDSPFYFRGKDLMKLFGIKSRGSAYVEFARVTKELMGKVISYRPDGSNKKLSQRPLLSMADHDSSNGIIGSKVHIDIKPHLKNLTEKFAEYKLKSVTSFKSNNSIILYKIAKMYGDDVEFVIDLNELVKAFDAESYRPDNFKSQVLGKSIKEINNKTDIELSYENVKEGKNVIAIKFKSIKNENIQETGLSQKEIQEIIKTSEIINLFKKNTNGADINQSTLTTLIELQGLETVKYYAENIQYYLSENTKNIQGLFVDAVKKHGTDKEYTKKCKILKLEKPSQRNNFDQREYDEEYYDNFFTNTKSENRDID